MLLTEIVDTSLEKASRYYRSLNDGGKGFYWIGVGGGTFFVALAEAYQITQGDEIGTGCLLSLAALQYAHMAFGYLYPKELRKPKQS